MKVSKYLSVNSQILALISLMVIILVSLMVFLGLHKSILTEFTYVLIILAVSLFLFLFIGLYNGFIVSKDHPGQMGEFSELPFPETKSFFKYWFDILFKHWRWLDVILTWGIAVFLGALLLIMLIYFSLTALYVIVFLLIIFYWLFYWAYRVVFRHSRETKGDILKSFIYSLSYTVLYSGLFFVLIQSLKYFSH